MAMSQLMVWGALVQVQESTMSSVADRAIFAWKFLEAYRLTARVLKTVHSKNAVMESRWRWG